MSTVHLYLLHLLFRHRARHLELDEVLEYIRDHAADREAWDMADQGEHIGISFLK